MKNLFNKLREAYKDGSTKMRFEHISGTISSANSENYKCLTKVSNNIHPPKNYLEKFFFYLGYLDI